LIDDNIAELKQKINSIEPEFAQLQKIRDDFQQEIQNTKEKESKAIAISFQSYMLDLEHSFERIQTRLKIYWRRLCP
jgi:FtsZ-binding cell division protein ZapB